jgi:hypothetical protein
MAKKRSKGVIGSKSGRRLKRTHKLSLSIKKRRERKEKRDGRLKKESPRVVQLRDRQSKGPWERHWSRHPFHCEGMW